MTQLIQQVAQASLSTEFLYSFIIIAVSLIIYFGTKELYNLTSHKGIKYFRLAFLFFGVAFFFRSFIRFIVTIFEIPELLNSNLSWLGSLSLFLFMYASSMAIFYLLYSVMWKKWNGDKILLFHGLALIIAGITLAVRDLRIVIVMHLILFVFILIVTLISYEESKKARKGQHLHGIYLLLFSFWILNIMDLVVINPFGSFKLLIYIASISLFLTILYKVIKKIG
jgi:hypothetical protein